MVDSRLPKETAGLRKVPVDTTASQEAEAIVEHRIREALISRKLEIVGSLYKMALSSLPFCKAVAINQLM
jgi:hypothetical protein